jgi:antitoxin component YwqK of YwqJK toxin-antitoxin module
LKNVLFVLMLLIAQTISAQVTVDSIGPNETITRSYSSGQLVSEKHSTGGTFRWPGELEPRVISFYKDGKYIDTNKVVSGFEPCIIEKTYYKNGRLERKNVERTDSALVETITDTSYYESGSIKAIGTSRWKVFLDMDSTGMFTGKISSTGISFYESGKLKEKYISDGQDVSDTAYYENGAVRAVSAGQAMLFYREDGTLKLKRTIRNGELSYEDYDLNGNLIVKPK